MLSDAKISGGWNVTLWAGISASINASQGTKATNLQPLESACSIRPGWTNPTFRRKSNSIMFVERNPTTSCRQPERYESPAVEMVRRTWNVVYQLTDKKMAIKPTGCSEIRDMLRATDKVHVMFPINQRHSSPFWVALDSMAGSFPS